MAAYVNTAKPNKERPHPTAVFKPLPATAPMSGAAAQMPGAATSGTSRAKMPTPPKPGPTVPPMPPQQANASQWGTLPGSSPYNGISAGPGMPYQGPTSPSTFATTQQFFSQPQGRPSQQQATGVSPASQAGQQAGTPGQQFGLTPPWQIQTSIEPSDIFSPQQTQESLNHQRAQLAIQNNPAGLKKGLGGPGRSLGWGAAAQIAPKLSEAASQSATLGVTVPFADQAANMQFNRQGQEARDAEGLGLAQLGTQGQQLATNEQNMLWNDNFNKQLAMLRTLGLA